MSASKKLAISKNFKTFVIIVLFCIGLGFFSAEGRLYFGMSIINILKLFGTPLIFFSILDGLCRSEIRLKSGGQLLFFSTMNAAVAGFIALNVLTVFPVGHYFSDPVAKSFLPKSGPITPPSFDLISMLQKAIPNSILDPFINNQIITLVIAAVVIGAAIRTLKTNLDPADQKGLQALENLIHGTFLLLITLLGWIIKAIPIAFFCVVTYWLGEKGFGVFKVLGLFILIIFSGMILQVGLYYSFLIAWRTKKSPLAFFRQAAGALATAFGTGSSLATLPVTLKTLQNKMGVSSESAQLSACIGTNLNHVGILLYEAVAALFIAQVHGIPLNIGGKLQVLAMSTIAAVGIAGIPEAGLITLSLVLSSVGLPLTWVPLLMTIDWFVGRLRATTNVASDLVVAHLLDSGIGTRRVKRKSAPIFP